MLSAIECARQINSIFGRDVKAVCKALHLNILEEDLAGRLKEIYFGDYVVIQKSLSFREKRELVTHAIGHHILHKGNQIIKKSSNSLLLT